MSELSDKLVKAMMWAWAPQYGRVTSAANIRSMEDLKAHLRGDEDTFYRALDRATLGGPPISSKQIEKTWGKETQELGKHAGG